MTLANFFSWVDRFESYMVENPEDMFSRDEAHILAVKVSGQKPLFPLWNQTYGIIKPQHDKTNRMTVHPAKTQISLGIRPVWSVFAVRSHQLSAQRRLWSDWADAWADLSLRWAHTHFVCIVMSWLNIQIWALRVNLQFLNKEHYFTRDRCA